MATVANRSSAWADLVWQYLHGPVAAFPTADMSAALADSFPCSLVSWNEGDTRLQQHHMSMAQPIDGWPTRDEVAEAPQLMRIHPLLCWYETTQDPKPSDIRSVPRDAVPRGGFELVTEMLSDVGVDHQLAIPAHLSGGSYRTFVMGRPDDFTDEELDLARRIQPLLALTLRHSAVISRTTATVDWSWTLRIAPEGPTAALPTDAHVDTVVAASDAAGLTCRELAVLRLLAEGGTAYRIGHQLGISPRTVHSHLSSIYRKLEADGRICALVEGRRRGLIS